MSDLESFSGFDAQSDAMDPGSFERFKERMAAAAAGLKSLQASEQRQKKTEDDLVKILLKFIQSGQKRDILLLVSRLLEENVPAGFIVSILLLSNVEIQQQLGLKILPSVFEAEQYQVSDRTTLPDYYLNQQSLPLKIKMTIEHWIQEISRRSVEYPGRILQTILEPGGEIKLQVRQLAGFSLRDFLANEGITIEFNQLKHFMDMMLQGIVKKLHYNDSKKSDRKNEAIREGINP